MAKLNVKPPGMPTLELGDFDAASVTDNMTADEFYAELKEVQPMLYYHVLAAVEMSESKNAQKAIFAITTLIYSAFYNAHIRTAEVAEKVGKN